jgi:hypothetical protein
MLTEQAAAIDWLRDAFGHLKVVGHTEHAAAIFAKAAVALDADKGVVDLKGSAGIDDFITAASNIGSGSGSQNSVVQVEQPIRSPGYLACGPLRRPHLHSRGSPGTRTSGQCPDFSACLNVAEFRLSPH